MNPVALGVAVFVGGFLAGSVVLLLVGALADALRSAALAEADEQAETDELLPEIF